MLRVTPAESAGPAVAPGEPRVRPVVPTDLASVEALLSASHLPFAGVAEAFGRFVVADVDGVVVGTAGLEVHGPDGLLRSVAVRLDWRGRGLGERLTRAIVDAARAEGLGRLWLLTTTAASFFPRHGFVAVDRDAVSGPVRESVEFLDACPATAVVQCLHLDDRP